jgi:DUF971 family protein
VDVYPINLELLEGNRLLISWNDNQKREYTFAELRSACPCATCREKRSAPPPPANLLTVLSPAEAKPLTIQGMTPVGNYAYSIAFSDGHDSGIFTIELLRGLGRVVS